MLWIKIVQFIIWIVVSFILYCPFLYLYNITLNYLADKRKEHKVVIWLSLGFIMEMISILEYIFTVWILTWMFFLELYLMLLLMSLVGVIILALMLWRIGALNNKGISRLHLKERVITKERQNIKILGKNSLELNLHNLALIIGLVDLVIIFYIFFIMNVSLEIMAKYIIVVSFLAHSSFIITQLFYKIPILSSPRLDTELRMDYLATSFFGLFILSFFIYFILWALNIPLSLTILVIGGFEIHLLFMVFLGIFALFIFFLVLPYSIGENRVKNEEIMFLEKRVELVKEIEKIVDLTDFEKSKMLLNAENEKISKEYNSINEKINGEISYKQQYYENLDYTSLEITELLKAFFKHKLSYMDSLRRYGERITFTLKSETLSAYADLDNLTDHWKDIVNGELKEVKKRRPLFWKTISVALFIWTLLQTYLGVSLTDILETLL